MPQVTSATGYTPGMDEDSWEARMAAKAAERSRAAAQAEAEQRYGVFAQWLQSDDPPEILPEILAARCLGISYGDPGPELEPDICRQCWGDRYVWLGNAWGMEHTPPGFNHCQHACHQDEICLAAG
jgi:hypothetical protein